MKLVHCLLSVFLFLGLAEAGYAATCTGSSCAPPTSTNAPQTSMSPVTLTVTHVASNVPQNHYVSCPTSQTITTSQGKISSPVSNGSLISSEFFPYGWTGASSGWLVYRCSETYWDIDPHYQALVNNVSITTCQQSTPWTEVCTTRGTNNNNLSGILPIHFVVRNPPQAMVRNDNMGSFSRIGVAAFPAAPQVILNGSGSPNVALGQTVEFSGMYTVGSTQNMYIQWGIYYTQTDGGGNGWTAPPGVASAYCPGNSSGGYARGIPITNDMLGKTCELSCDTGTWGFYQPTGDNCCAARRTFITAPLIVQCH